jgi:hypothetical protein
MGVDVKASMHEVDIDPVSGILRNFPDGPTI